MRILRAMANAFDCGNIEFLLTFLQSKGFFRPTLKVNKIESKPQSLMITLIIDIGLYNRLKNLVNQRVICEQEYNACRHIKINLHKEYLIIQYFVFQHTKHTLYSIRVPQQLTSH
jgi:hypothetical protein